MAELDFTLFPLSTDVSSAFFPAFTFHWNTLRTVCCALRRVHSLLNANEMGRHAADIESLLSFYAEQLEDSFALFSSQFADCRTELRTGL